MATFHFDLVSPEKVAFSGDVDQVDVPGVEGDFGVLAGHAPVVAAIRPGILTVTTGSSQQKIVVLGGIAEVSEKGLTVLADVATPAPDMDLQEFAATIQTMEQQLPRARGLFAGVTLNGSTISQDRDANDRFYGTGYRTSQVVFDGLATTPAAPDAVAAWKAALTKYAK